MGRQQDIIEEIHPGATSPRFRSGFAVVPLIGGQVLDQVRSVVDALDLDEEHPFFASPAAAWGPVAARAHEELAHLLRPHLEVVLPHHRLFMAAVTSKGRYKGGRVPYHQDWTYTDERRHRTVFLWCPLVDAGPANGGLRVIPGSHRWTTGLRPSRPLEATQHLQDELHAASVPVRVRAGRALAFDPALIHGSGTNTTPQPRPALTLALAPREAELLHFHLDDDGDVHGYRVDEAFFTEHPYGTRPTRFPAATPWTSPVMRADVVEPLGDRRAITRAKRASLVARWRPTISPGP